MTSVAKRVSDGIKRRISATINRWSQEGSIGIALSGGVDSCSLLAEMMEQGIRPVVISYTPNTHESTDFQMARAAAEKLKLEFVPVLVDMKADSLERLVRSVLSLGYMGKVEVECLSPIVAIMEEARSFGVEIMFTGDQADGYFALGKWASHNADRAAGIPRGERTNVQKDTNPSRLDYLRRRYWELDKSCSGGVRFIGYREGLDVVVPYRDKNILDAFSGTLWSEINRPRMKEPIRLAYERWFNGPLPVRKAPVNLNKGDSYFSQTMEEVLMAQAHLQGKWSTPRGLYSAMARGLV